MPIGVKGFQRGHLPTYTKKGENHWNWKGGIYINPHNGYCYFSTAKNRKRLVHRVVWEKHFGKIPKGYEIHHKNGNKQDNEIENLEILPHKKHQFKYHFNVIQKMWEKTGKSPKFSKGQIIQIKQMRNQGLTLEKIAELFGVSHSTIWIRLKTDYCH